ncbi:MAG TPA: SHOCT domain-containing protein [Pricia sp.]|nr:SHOCT domain-containing protein [Pricia sp.]
MKNAILAILLFSSTTLSAQKKNQKLDKYTASNGVTYNVGGEVELGNGSSHDGSFIYVTVAGIGQNVNDPAKNRFRSTGAGAVGKIKRIRNYNYRGTQGVHFYIGLGAASNYMLNVESAIENCEVVPCPEDGQPQATDKYDQLAKLKDLFDEGVLTEKEYEAEKKKLLGQ